MKKRFAFLLICSCSLLGALQAEPDTQWETPLKNKLEQMADSLTKHVVPWSVPRRTYRVERYGATANGETVNTVAIQAAIDACSKRGGGVVLFSKGDYVTGTIQLKSNVMIEVAEGSRILGSTKLEDYPHLIEKHVSIMSEYYRFKQSLIYAEDQVNVGIRGAGEIYFRGERQNFPGPQTIGEIKDRPLGIRMVKCQNVVLQNISLRNSAAWMQNYISCLNLILDGVKIENHGNFNNDGLDPDGCVNVIVRNCHLNTEDDAMCLKGSAMTPSENILIENCTFYSTCNALKVGTDTQGDFKNIIVRNVVLGGIPEPLTTTHDKRASSTGITIATVDGGNVENMLIQNATINQANCPIYLRIGSRGRVLTADMKYKWGYQDPNFVPGHLKRIIIDNVSGERNFKQGSFISGIPNHLIEDVVIRNVDLKMSGKGEAHLITRHVIENESGYPDAHRIAASGLPAFGFYFRHAKNLTLENIKISPVNPDARPEIFNGGDAYNIKYNELFIQENQVGW